MVNTATRADGAPRRPTALAPGVWECKLAALGLADAEPLSSSECDPARRVFKRAERVYKVILLDYATTSSLRNLSPRQEFDVLQRLAGLPGVPQDPHYRREQDVDVLSYRLLEGRPCGPTDVAFVEWARNLLPLASLLWRISLRGVAHNDVHTQNLLKASGNRISLLDFDQASSAGIIGALAANFLGYNRSAQVHGSFVHMFKDRLKTALPSPVLGLWRTASWSSAGIAFRRWVQGMPRLPRDAGPRLRCLHEAWQLAQLSSANGPGQLACYYSLRIDGVRLPGERPWADRWEQLSEITNYRGRRILELGCNLGLLSCFLLKEKAAEEVLCVDVDADILAAAQKVSQGFGVSPQYKRIDFDAPLDWERELVRFNPDVVFALNVVNWVSDKERFLRFLGGFPEVIIEGHEPFDEERRRLLQYGFTTVELLSLTDRSRPLMRCRR